MTSQRIQYGGRPPYWKSSFGYIPTNDYPINAKFCRIKQNHVLTQDTWPKYQISKIKDGESAAIWKWFYRYNSTGNHPISAQFSVQPQVTLPRIDGHMTKCHNFANSSWQTDAIMKSFVSAISGRFIVWLTRNFVQRSIITLRHRLRYQNTPAVDIWTAIIKQEI